MGIVTPPSGITYDIPGLDICTPYWLVARAATCGAEANSVPFKLDLGDAALFTLDLQLQQECSAWININNAMKINAIEKALNETLYDTPCKLILVNCFSGSTLTCSAKDSTYAAFRYTVTALLSIWLQCLSSIHIHAWWLTNVIILH